MFEVAQNKKKFQPDRSLSISLSNVVLKMLWEKEINCDLYVDIFENEHYPIRLGRLKRKKNNTDALAARLAGNEKFKAGDFNGAMAKYNQSICLAECDSEYLSIAYANRSSCFEKLKKFSCCLKDIQLAKESHYPQRLIHKLDARKQKCITEMQSEEPVPNQYKMSCPADENLPCMANVLRIDFNEEYRRMITAIQDINIGEPILIEENYVHLVVGENIKCHYCGKKNVNFVPCDKCGGAMFCNELCSKSSFHQIECEMLFDLNICKSGNFFPVYVLRSLIIGLSAFESTSEMITFVENCMTGDPYEIPHSTSTSKLKYRIFFKLSSFVPDRLSKQFLEYRKMAYSVYQSIKSSSIGVRFETKSHQRFLAHLIMHHIFILRTNSFGNFMSTLNTGVNSAEVDDDYEQHLYLITSFFNHSCCPNVAIFGKNNLSICKAILPIQKGDQLFVSYVDEDDDELKTVAGRKNFLQNNFGFNCKCSICEKGVLINTLKLQDDSSFISVVNGLKELEENFNMSRVNEIIQNCIQFLTKFPKMILSPESIHIKNKLVQMMQLTINMED